MVVRISTFIAKPDNYMADVAAPASLGFPLSYHRRVVATKSTTSYNYPGKALLLYDGNNTIIHFCKVLYYFLNVGQIAFLSKNIIRCSKNFIKQTAISSIKLISSTFTNMFYSFICYYDLICLDFLGYTLKNFFVYFSYCMHFNISFIFRYIHCSRLLLKVRCATFISELACSCWYSTGIAELFIFCGLALYLCSNLRSLICAC